MGLSTWKSNMRHSCHTKSLLDLVQPLNHFGVNLFGLELRGNFKVVAFGNIVQACDLQQCGNQLLANRLRREIGLHQRHRLSRLVQKVLLQGLAQFTQHRSDWLSGMRHATKTLFHKPLQSVGMNQVAFNFIPAPAYALHPVG